VNLSFYILRHGRPYAIFLKAEKILNRRLAGLNLLRRIRAEGFNQEETPLDLWY
jgi:hypothetical protein